MTPTQRPSIRRPIALVAASLMVLAAAVPAAGTTAGINGRISFSRFVEATASLEIFTARADGSDIKQLTNSGFDRVSESSDWSPNGSSIAFESDRVDSDGNTDTVQVYVMPWNGGPPTQLTTGPGFHGEPAWAPDGSRLAISADWGDFPASQGIWTIPASDANGVTVEEAVQVTRIPAGIAFDADPQFSPDGRWIAFVRYSGCSFEFRGQGTLPGCTSAIHKVRVDGSGLQRLTPWGQQASAPDWSPDGRLIAFDSCDTGNLGCTGDIYVMRVDGKGRTRLTHTEPLQNPSMGFANFQMDLANNPVWSPDGSMLLFTHWTDGGFPTELVVIPSTGGPMTQVVGGPFFQNRADWGSHP